MFIGAGGLDPQLTERVAEIAQEESDQHAYLSLVDARAGSTIQKGLRMLADAIPAAADAAEFRVGDDVHRQLSRFWLAGLLHVAGEHESGGDIVTAPVTIAHHIMPWPSSRPSYDGVSVQINSLGIDGEHCERSARDIDPRRLDVATIREASVVVDLHKGDTARRLEHVAAWVAPYTMSEEYWDARSGYVKPQRIGELAAAAMAGLTDINLNPDFLTHQNLQRISPELAEQVAVTPGWNHVQTELFLPEWARTQVKASH